MLWHIISIILKCLISFRKSELELLLGVCRVFWLYIMLYTVTGLTSQSLSQKYSAMTQDVIIFICTYQPIVFNQVHDIFAEIHPQRHQGLLGNSPESA